jgi:hypothetical protein
MNEGDEVTLSLRRDDALVLFELLHRWIDDENGERVRPHIQHDAELWALNSLCCALEPIIAPLPQDYAKAVQTARTGICERAGEWPDD